MKTGILILAAAVAVGASATVPAHGGDTVQGEGLDAPVGYVPAMLSNGSVCMATDFLGGVPPVHPWRPPEGRFQGVSPGVFVAGRRMLYDLYGHGSYRLTLAVDGKARDVPDRWSQTLDPLAARSVVTNVFGEVVRVVETFVAAGADVIAVRQTFPGTDPSRVAAGLDYAEPKGERIVGRWEPSPDGRAFVYTAYGRKVDRGRITLRSVREGDAFVTFVSYGKPYGGTYAALRARHENAWGAYYAASSVVVPDERLMRIRRMAEYQLKCNVTRWNLPVGIFPSHWSGRSFAFDELYGMQGLLSSGHFDEARHVADFRFDTLGQAKHRVGGGGRGARWYWECMEDSAREGAPSGNWLDHIFHMAAIARSCGLAAAYADDTAYLRQKAYPVMRECARFYRSQYVYDLPDGTSFVGRCTDLERLGAARDRPCMTTCGVIHTFRICADAAERLGVDAAEAADWRSTADRLVKSLPVQDGRFVPTANDPGAVSMGTLAGYFPFPVFPKGHPEQTAAVDFYLAQGAKAGNMYAQGKNVCPWYAGTMAMAALRAGRHETAYRLMEGVADMAGRWGEFWEINEPGVRIRPWFMTAAGNCLYAINSLLLLEADGDCRIGAGVPKEWRDWSFRLPAESGYEVEFAMRDGKASRLVVRCRHPSPERHVRLVLPDGSRRDVTLDRAEVAVIAEP